jgi:hypothetical protein
MLVFLENEADARAHEAAFVRIPSRIRVPFLRTFFALASLRPKQLPTDGPKPESRTA